MSISSSSSSFAGPVLSILRIMTGLLFVEHGTAKVLGYPPGAAPHIGLHLTSMPGVSGVLELVGGILIVAGLFTRLTAFLLSGEMAVAYFMVHAPHSFFPIVNKGEIAVLYCFVFLYLAVAGGGPWSADHLRGKA